jgi:Xaa-Pro aminopeptidase
MPYQSETRQLLASLLSVPINKIGDEISLELTKAIVELRSIKEEKEITAIENMVTETNLLHRIAMQSAKPGIYEREILASMNQYLTAYSYTNPFQPICSVRGEVLHNPFYNNVMQKGDLLLVDAGIEGTSGYSSDITRVTPVGGSFSQQQKEIYEIVLSANLKAIDKIEPGIAYSDIHSFAALTITQGLISLGLMKGNASDAQAQGAHALFFPHGLGHMLGLDTHDMEALGEDYVGYNSSFKRSTQFGTSSLRLARKLEQNFVITVEPGIYFIPELIAQWKRDKKNMAFINYDKVEKFIGFGGIRIEDNVVVTEKGCKVLSAQIPKNVAEVEAIIGK